MECSHPRNRTNECHMCWCPKKELDTQAMWDCEYGDPTNPHRSDGWRANAEAFFTNMKPGETIVLPDGGCFIKMSPVDHRHIDDDMFFETSLGKITHWSSFAYKKELFQQAVDGFYLWSHRRK